MDIGLGGYAKVDSLPSPLRLPLAALAEPLSAHSPWLDITHDAMDEEQDIISAGALHTMAGNAGYCAMRGSCGPKDWTSKPLPCPSNEPASEVR